MPGFIVGKDADDHHHQDQFKKVAAPLLGTVQGKTRQDGIDRQVGKADPDFKLGSLLRSNMPKKLMTAIKLETAISMVKLLLATSLANASEAR